MKDKKSDDAIADRVAKLEERQDRLEFKNNLLFCITIYHNIINNLILILHYSESWFIIPTVPQK